MRDALVIGGGAAGVSAAAALERKGIDALLLERDEVGASWRDRYDRLRLNSTRRLSSLPRLPIPRENGRWVHASEYHRYLLRYADQLGVKVRSGVCAERIDGARGGFRVRASDGDHEARLVVVATGHDREPHIPDWPGRDGFQGQLLHSADYRRPAPFRGRRVLVVGAGNSGMEIALDLAEGGAASVQLAVRTPPILLAHEWHGVPVTWFGVAGQPLPGRARDLGTRLLSRAMFGDLAPFGLPEPSRGMSEQLRLGRLPTIDKGTVAAIKRGEVEVVPGLEGFEGPAVLLSGGRSVEPDVVIAATAYRPGLAGLVGHLGALDGEDHPREDAVPGLFFIGYRVPLTGLLSQYHRDAPRLARAAVRELERL